MKKFLSVSLLTVALSSINAQTALENNPKLEFGFQGISLGYELPVSEKLLLDANFGFGGVNVFTDNTIGYKFGKTASENNSTFFLRGQMRYYLNREKREERNRSMVNNAGSFIGFQTKYNFSGNGLDVGKTWLNDVHFGQQLPLGQSFIFRYHVGIGYGSDLDFKKSSVYPALGATFGYSF